MFFKGFLKVVLFPSTSTNISKCNLWTLVVNEHGRSDRLVSHPCCILVLAGTRCYWDRFRIQRDYNEDNI